MTVEPSRSASRIVPRTYPASAGSTIPWTLTMSTVGVAAATARAGRQRQRTRATANANATFVRVGATRRFYGRRQRGSRVRSGGDADALDLLAPVRADRGA